MNEPTSPVAPSVAAGFLLLAREFLSEDKKWPRTVADVLRITGAGKSQAYEILDRLRAILPTLLHPPGRPVTGPVEPQNLDAIHVAVREYLSRHPGACYDRGERRIYSDDFRRFVLALTQVGQPGEGLTLAQLSHATGVPPGTLKDWLNPPRSDRRPTIREPLTDQAPTTEASPSDMGDVIRDTHLRLIASLWPLWTGPFQAFCTSLRTEHRLPYSDFFVGSFLHGIGLRHRRSKPPVEAPWSSDTFRVLFPSAQWLGDGTPLAFVWEGERFVFNLEAMLDSATNATVGLAVTDTEDEEAVRLAYEAARQETGQAPFAVTLDNLPSNHSPGTLKALADTMVLRATPGRGQSKAPVEGSFGLLQQALPPLVLDGASPRERARQALQLILTAWFVGRNGKPRKKLHGRTPAEAYAQDRPSPDDIAKALKWFQELQKRQERARLTRAARRDPVRRKLLSVGLAELGIEDPEQRIEIALAFYCRDAIVRGLATLRAKLEQETVPTDADRGPYLGGIIRNIHTRIELDSVARHLLRERIRLRDITLEPLQQEARKLGNSMTTSELPQAFVDRALAAIHRVDFEFWTQASVEALSTLPTRRALYLHLSRRIAASFKVERHRREDLIDRLAQIAAA